MKNLIYLVAVIIFFSCSNNRDSTNKDDQIDQRFSRANDLLGASKEKKIDILLREFTQEFNPLVVAHRGDWRGACENSILAIENAIEMGVDIIEIDLKKTKDNQLILMHDHTLDRTTTGKGYVRDHTLGEIKKFYLKDGAGHKTLFKVPTLKEALGTAKGKVLINLDQSFEYFEHVLPVLKETNTLKQIIVKGYNKPIKEVQQKIGIYIDSVLYMPIVKLGVKGYKPLFKETLDNDFKAVEFTFSSDTIAEVSRLHEFQKKGTRVWVNALWPEHNAGHHDDRALKEPDSAYGWLISKGVNIIQTDRPELLLSYLRNKNLRNQKKKF